MPLPSWLAKLNKPIRLRRRQRSQFASQQAARTDRHDTLPPSPLDDPPVPLDPSTISQLAPRVVLIERLDSQGRHWGSACAFIDERGLVVTNRHCIEGAASLKLNLGAAGMFDLPDLCADSPELDIVALGGDFPDPDGPPLAWNPVHPQPHAPVSILVRTSSGQLRESPGRAGEVGFGHYSELVLATSALGWLGCSGSPLLDAAGNVVAVVSKLGDPRPSQRKTTAGASLAADILALPRLQGQLRSWPDSGADPTRAKFEEHKRTAKDWYAQDPNRALAAANIARRLRPGDLGAARAASWFLDRAGRGQEGAAVLLTFAKNQRDWRAWYLLGNRAYMLRDLPEAIANYDRSLRLSPQPATYFWLGCAQWLRGDLSAAILSIEASIRLEPRPQASWEHLLRLYMLTNQPGEALRVAQHQVDMNPTNPDLLATLASMQLRSGRQSEHLATITALRAANPFLANRATLPPSAAPESSNTNGETTP